MSPRAAARLESLGFASVFDYAAGEADWLAAGLSTEGDAAGQLRAGHAIRSGVPTCRIDERVAEVSERVRAAGWDQCVSVNDAEIVLGRLRRRELAGAIDSLVEDVMQSGPATFRPDVPLAELAERMRGQRARSVLITASDGTLLGALYREDAERMLKERK